MLAFRLHGEKSDSNVNRGHSLSNDSGEVELCQTIHCGMQQRIFSEVGRSFPINGPTLAHQQTKWHDHVPSTDLDYAQSRRHEAAKVMHGGILELSQIATNYNYFTRITLTHPDLQTTLLGAWTASPTNHNFANSTGHA